MDDVMICYDVIIRGGMIADGTGKPAYRADVAVMDGKIAAIGDLSAEKAKKTLDARGLVVAPGFIDAHAHSDTCFLKDAFSSKVLPKCWQRTGLSVKSIWDVTLC